MGINLRHVFTFISLFIFLMKVHADHALPPVTSPLYWPQVTYYDWTGSWDQPASRPFLVCSANQSNNRFTLKDVTNSKVINDRFTSFEECRQSNEGSRPNHICLPSTQQSGKFYLLRQSDGQRIGQYYSSQAKCLNSIANVRKQLMCAASVQKPGKFYLFNIQTGKNDHNAFFADETSCISSLSRIHSQLLCLPSTQKPGKYFLESVDGTVLQGSNRPYFNSIEICNNAIDTRYANHICAESTSNPGKGFLLNLATNKRDGEFYTSVSSCQEQLQRARKKHICSPAKYHAGKFVILNLETNLSISVDNRFADAATCNRSVVSMASKFVCMPSKKYTGKFYLFDWQGDSLRDVYFDNQEQCITSLEPWITYEQQLCTRQLYSSSPNTGSLEDFSPQFLSFMEVPPVPQAE